MKFPSQELKYNHMSTEYAKMPVNMKKFSPFVYPILFAANPVLLLLSSNISDLPATQAVLPLLLLCGLSGLLMLGLYRLFKDSHRAAFVTFLAVFWFFFYGTVYRVIGAVLSAQSPTLQHIIFFPIWSLAFLFMGSGILWRRIQSPVTITNFLNLICAIVFVISVGRIAIDLAPRYLSQPDARDLLAGLPAQPSQTPDIYYIILDGYARQDVLQDVFDYDNTPFLQALESRGFYIAGQSQSNYMQTALSLASSMNLEYLSDLPTALPDRGQLISRIRHSRLRQGLEHLGYKIVAFDSGYLPTTLDNADHYLYPKDLSHFYKHRDLEAYLWINSVAVILIENKWVEAPITRYSSKQTVTLYTFEQLAQVPALPGPKFVFVHIVAPHPPFIFDQNGPINPDAYYILSDGNRWGGKDAAQDYIQSYIAQLEFINRQTLQTLDAILAASPTPPVIILQSDHGSGVHLNFETPELTCYYERFSILNAYYLPEVSPPPADISPVNSFRFIFNAYFDTNLPLLENHQYYSTWNQPYLFMDVTGQTQQPCSP